jgi:hypothetical protein
VRAEAVATYGSATVLPSRPRPVTYTAGTATLAGAVDDQAAVERYGYLLRTSPPGQLEQVHAEDFARLTSVQRWQVLTALGNQVSPGERLCSALSPHLACGHVRPWRRGGGHASIER